MDTLKTPFPVENCSSLSAEPSRRMAWLHRILHTPETASRLVFLLGPIASYCGVELLNGNNPITDLSPLQIGLNLLWYFLVFGIFRLLLGRRKLSATVSSILFFLIGLANYYVFTFRGRVIFPCDLLTLRTAANVAHGYDYTPTVAVWQAVSILLIYLLTLVVLPKEHGPNRLGWKTSVLSLALMGSFLFSFFGTGMLPAIGIYAQQWKTQRNGFVLNFTTALSYSFVKSPSGYSPETVQQIADTTAVLPVATTDLPAVIPEQPTNLLVVMNESFADFTSSFPQLELSDDPMPFTRSLTKNTVKGMMISPVTGGGTANVEFEYLTGDSLAFLPTATVAYQLYLYDGIPSMVSQANALGYETAAFHPYKSSGWNRTSVYQWMGFDHQYYEEDVVNPKLVRKYISDESDYEQLYRLTDECQQPLFVYNVTMQNHSSYRQGWNNLDPSIQLAGDFTGTSPSTEQYFSLILASDDANRQLIEHYQNYDEKTMIVFFGDHQPPLGNTFYEKLYGKKLDDRTPEEVMQEYETPFFIWANYDIPEQDGLTVSTNYLGALTAQLAGFPLTKYQSLLLRQYDHIPTATVPGFITADGQVVQRESDLPANVQTQYEDYRLCAYNHLFDHHHHPQRFYEN